MGFRDPTCVYHEGMFHLFYTYVCTENDGAVYMYTAHCASGDLIHWSCPTILTERNRSLNYSSPGNIVRVNGRWIMCLQSYCRENGEKYGNDNCRLWAVSSDDLACWDSPTLLRVKGPNVAAEDMGRMIDPYLIEDKDKPGRWWCLYKQNGVSMSYSDDFKNWHYTGRCSAGENVCILVKDNQYWMFHSPKNGIGLMRSSNLLDWEIVSEQLEIGSLDWDWARGRLTAGFVLDGRHIPGVGKYLMFYHGTGPEDEEVIFDNFASIGLAWSDDLQSWHWPTKVKSPK